MLLKLHQIDKEKGLDEASQFVLAEGLTTLGRAEEPISADIPHIPVGTSWPKVSRFHLHFEKIGDTVVARGGPPVSTQRASTVTEQLSKKFPPRVIKDGERLVLYADGADVRSAGRAIFVDAGLVEQMESVELAESSSAPTLPPSDFIALDQQSDGLGALQRSIENVLSRLEAHTIDCSEARKDVLSDFAQIRAQQEADLQQFRVELETESLQRSREIERLMVKVSTADSNIWRMAAFAIVVSIGSLTIGNYLDPGDREAVSEYLEVASEVVQIVPPVLAALGLGWVATSASKESRESLAGLTERISAQAENRQLMAERGASYPISQREMRALGIVDREYSPRETRDDEQG